MKVDVDVGRFRPKEHSGGASPVLNALLACERGKRWHGRIALV